MKSLIVFAAVCSICWCKPQSLRVDDTAAFNDIEDYLPYNTGISTCYGVSCPPRTVHCSKRSETSADYTKWITTVQCNDQYGNVLNSVTESSVLATQRPLYDNRYNYGSGRYYTDGSNYYEK